MKNIFRSLSARGRGQIKDGLITEYELFSFDMISSPGVNGAYIMTEEEMRLQIEFERQKLKQERVDKLNKLNGTYYF